MRKLRWIFLFTCLLFSLTGCIVGSANRGNPPHKTQYAAWLPYWDIESAAAELRKTERNLKSLSYFVAYFDEKNHVFMPPQLQEQWNLQRDKKRGYDVYLTFVNDKVFASGASVMKDTTFLLELWRTDESMEAHIDELIHMTQVYGFDGLEIDYEQLWGGDAVVRERFLLFTYRLALKAQQAKLKLRIVLEPGADFRAPFCRGPEYVVMLYNLYGTHSDAGPKADFDFIAAKTQAMRFLPGEPAVALATGGCQWGSDGSRSFISEQEAAALAKEYKAIKRRDENSACVVFQYQKDGVDYEVWYADFRTLREWIKCAALNGVNKISLWRLGSNITIEKAL